MPNAVGDNLTSQIRRAAVSVQVQLDKGAGAAYYTLKPSADGTIVETPVGKRALDGAFHISYYQQEIYLEYVQTDEDTMADMFSSQLESQWHITGTPSIVTLEGGQQLTLTFRWELKPHGEGYESVFAVRMSGLSTTSVPMLR